MKPKTYYAKDLFKNPGQAQAAQTLLNCLLVQRMMRGERVSYWARKWGRKIETMIKSTALMRSLVVARQRGARDLSLHTPDPMSVVELVEGAAVYGPLLDEIEAEASLALADERAEALIRGMFVDEPPALFAYMETRPKREPKRKPGRPPGSKNKPKPGQTEEGWLMPDGTRVKL